MIKYSKKTKDIVNNTKKDCIDCNKCIESCIMLDTYTNSIQNLFNVQIDKDTAFSCHLCGHCQSVCPKDIPLQAAFLSIREDYQYQTRIKSRAVDFHQIQSFSRIYSSKLKPSQRVFFPGCSLSASNPDLVMKIYNFIKEEDITLWKTCCGNPTHTLGKKDKFEKQINKLNDEMKSQGVKEIIVSCLNCYKVFSEHSNIKVTSLYEILDRMKLPTSTYLLDSGTIHDPCPTRNVQSIHDSVRSLLVKKNIQTTEFELTRKQTQCCGAGAMVKVMNPNLATNQAKQRTEQTESLNIITYCQECVETLGQHKNTHHILDVLFSDSKTESSSTVRKWLNRRTIKREADKLSKH